MSLINRVVLTISAAAIAIVIAASSTSAQISESIPFTALAALSDTYVVQASTTASYSDLYEEDPQEGTIEHFSPSGMFTDTSIPWLERLRISNDSVDSAMAVNLHRGGSSISWNTDYCTPATTAHPFAGPDETANTSDDWGLYLINVDDEQYVVFYADATSCGSGFVQFTVADVTVVRQDTGGASVQDFLRGLTDSRIVLALSADNSYIPAFAAPEPPAPEPPAPEPPAPEPPAPATEGTSTSLSASLQGDRTTFNWTDIEDAQVNDWIIEWHASDSATWQTLTSFDTPIKDGNGVWVSSTTVTHPGQTIFYAVRLGVGPRSNEVGIQYPAGSIPAATSTPAATPTPAPGAVGREGNTAAAVVTMPRVENQLTFWALLSVIAAASAAMVTRRFNIPHAGEITVVATVLPLAVGGIQGAVDPIITVVAILFGVALVIILIRINR